MRKIGAGSMSSSGRFSLGNGAGREPVESRLAQGFPGREHQSKFDWKFQNTYV
jgi:hypothetical protein